MATRLLIFICMLLLIDQSSAGSKCMRKCLHSSGDAVAGTDKKYGCAGKEVGTVKSLLGQTKIGSDICCLPVNNNDGYNCEKNAPPVLCEPVFTKHAMMCIEDECKKHDQACTYCFVKFSHTNARPDSECQKYRKNDKASWIKMSTRFRETRSSSSLLRFANGDLRT
jgi:hypothetical protein